MQWNNRLGSVSGAQKRREHLLNDLTHVPMPRRLYWGLLGALLELSWDPLGAGRLSLATGGGGGKEYGGGGGEEEEEDKPVEGWGRKKETTMKATTTTTSQP